jgi:predicted kinase
VVGSLIKRAGDNLNIAAYITGPSGAGKSTYVKQNYPADKYFILNTDKYASSIQGKDTVSINWEKALQDGQMSGKPIVIDAYHANPALMKMAKEKILFDPGRVKTLSQLIGRRKKKLGEAYAYSPEEKLERFNRKTRPIAQELGFKEKVAYTLGGHEELTNRALDALESRGIDLTEEQRARLIAANRHVDEVSTRGLLISDKYSPFHYHKGEEDFAHKMVGKFYNQAVQEKDTTKALDALGIALHTTQDQFAHSKNDVGPGIRGLITHIPIIGNSPDSIEAHPNFARRAVDASKRLISRFVHAHGDLGAVKKKNFYFEAELTPKELEEYETRKHSSAIRMLADQVLRGKNV